MNTLNRVLLGLFGVQLLLGLWVCTRGGGPTLHKATALLGDLDAEEVSRVQIFSRKEGDKTDTGPAITLSKETDGWVLSSHQDYPADGERVKGLISKLVAMTSRGPQTTSSSRHAQLEVAGDRYQRKIVVTTPRGERTVYLGATPGFGQLAVRIDDGDETHSVSDLTVSDADDQVSAWIDPTFLETPVDQMQAVTIETPTGTLALERGADRQWLAGGATADQAKVEAMLGKLSRIDLVDVAGVQPQAGWGFDRPQARITFALGTAPPPPENVDLPAPPPPTETIVLEVGAEQDGKYYVRALHKRHIVRVARASLEEVVAATPEKLGAAAPTPPAPAPGTPAPAAPGTARPPTPAAPAPGTARPPAPKPAAPKPAAPKPAAPKPAAPKPATP